MRATPGLQIFNCFGKPGAFFALTGLAWGLSMGAVSTGWSAPPDTSHVFNLNSTTVHGSLFGQEGSGTIVLTPKDWEGKAMSLADLLAMNAGIQTRRMGGMGSPQSLSIRGMTGNRVIVCIDGIPVGDASGSSFDFGAVDLNQLARVEVHKGQVPARLGGNAMGGVVNLVTRGYREEGGRLVVGYGSYKTHELALSAAGGLSPKARIASTLSLRGSDNDYPYTDRNGTEYNTTDDTRVRRKNSQYAQQSGLHRLVIRPGQHLVEFSLRHSQEKGGHPGQESQRTVTAGFAREWIQGNLLWRPPLSKSLPAAELSGGLRAEKGIFHYYFPLDGLGYSSNRPIVVGSLSQQADGALRLYGQPHSLLDLEYHITAQVEQMDPRDNDHASPLPKWQVHRQALAGAFEAHWALQPWASLRLRKQHKITRDAVDGGVFQSSYQDTLHSAKQLRPQLAYGAELRLGEAQSSWNWHWGFARSYRDPEAMERYGTRLGVLPNPDLKPELSWNLESGLVHSTAHTRTQLTVWQTFLQQGIVWLQSTTLTKPANMERARVRGLELETTWQPLSWLDLSSHYTLQDARNLTTLDGRRNSKLPGEPLHSGGVQMRLRTPANLEWEWQSQVHSEIYRDAANRKLIPAQTLHHGFLRWRPLPSTTLLSGVRNLLGTEYQDIHSAFPTPGRQYHLAFVQNF